MPAIKKNASKKLRLGLRRKTRNSVSEIELKLVDKIRNNKVGNRNDRWRHQPKFVATCREYDTAEIVWRTAVL